MPEIAKTRYTHEAIIDAIISNPGVSQNDLAREFGFTASWMSIIINSDAFQERLVERKAELSDPTIRASVEDRLDALAKRSLDKLLDRIDNNHPISTGDLVRMATLGAGDRNKRPAEAAVQQNLYVVNLPPPARDSNSWLATSSRGASESFIDMPGG
jgi:hypothetical protein